MTSRTVETRSVEATRAEGARVAAVAVPGDIYALVGELGAGKTEFVRGFVAALAPEASVRSPSFTIVNVYETPRFPVYHFDFYRLSDPSELHEIGFAEYLAGGGVCLIEWADLVAGELPEEGVRVVRFTDPGEGIRVIEHC